MKTNYSGSFRKNKLTTVYTCYDSQRKGVVTGIHVDEITRYAIVVFPDGSTENIPVHTREKKETGRGGARKGAGRKAGPKGTKKPYTVALFDSDIEKIRKKYGSLQKFVEKLIIYV